MRAVRVTPVPDAREKQYDDAHPKNPVPAEIE